MAQELRNLYVTIERGTDLAAADVNGKSDPYVVYYVGARPKSLKHASKTQVKKATLNPVWNRATSMSGKRLTDTLTLEVYDKDVVGKDDFLGQVVVSFEQLLKTTAPLPLVARPGKKDKVKGTLTVTATRAGVNGTTLGPTLARFLAQYVAETDSYQDRLFIESCFTEFTKLARRQPDGTLGMAFGSLPAWIGACFPTVANKEALLKLCKVYDDSGDGAADFAELMVLCKDMARIGKGDMPPVFIVASGLIGESLEAGTVERTRLAEVLRTKMVADAEDRDQAALEDVVERSVDQMMTAMDDNGDGVVTADEVRNTSPLFVDICKAFVAIPMKQE